MPRWKKNWIWCPARQFPPQTPSSSSTIGFPRALPPPFFLPVLTLALLTPNSCPVLHPSLCGFIWYKLTPKKRPVPEGQRGTQKRFIPQEFTQTQHRTKDKVQTAQGEGRGPLTLPSIHPPTCVRAHTGHESWGVVGPPLGAGRGRMEGQEMRPGPCWGAW